MKKKTSATIKHIKAFAWNAGGMMIVAVAGYISNLGDIRAIDPVQALNVAVLVLCGLIVNRATKEMNQG